LSADPTLLEAILLGLEGSAVARAFRGSLWLYPAVEILHIVGFVLLAGAAFVLDLRLLGRLRSLPITDAVHSLSRWARWSLILVVPSGSILFITDATTLAANPAFQLKLVLLAAAGTNAAIFHWVVFRDIGDFREDAWRDGAPLPLPARLVGVLSIVLWFSVIACGRLIAYV
jgi:hypothetical protein